MAALILLEQIRAHLVSQGLVRSTVDTGSGAPPCVLNPKGGPPQPEGNDTAFVTLQLSGQVPTDHLEGFLEEPVVEVIVRATNHGVGELLQRAIRVLLNDRHDFMVGSLHVQWCLLWRGIQPVPLPPGAKATTYDSTQSFRFQIRVAELTV